MVSQDRYSSLISIFKIALPSLALIILSALFLLPDKRTKIQAFDKIDKSILTIVKKAGLNKPSFRGTLSSGSNLEIYSKDIIPMNKEKSLIGINEIHARLEIDNKNGATAYAKRGVVNIGDKTAEFVGAVRVEGFSGVLIEAADLKIFYEEALAETNSPVFFNGAFGMIKAGSAKFHDMNQKSGSGYVLLFDKGVSMLYNFTEN